MLLPTSDQLRARYLRITSNSQSNMTLRILLGIPKEEDRLLPKYRKILIDAGLKESGFELSVAKKLLGKK